MNRSELYDWTVSGPWTEKNEQTDTEWKWKLEDGILFLAFKGSTSRMDWLQNFSFWIRPYRKQPILWFAHAGFVRKWKSVREDVFRLIEQMQDQFVMVSASGFSQGGAVAILCHEDLKFRSISKIVCSTTYGAPRVVWFWNRWKIHPRFLGIDRYEIKSDVVPKLPPGWMGYRRVGGCLLLGERTFSWPWEWETIHMSYRKYLEEI